MLQFRPYFYRYTIVIILVMVLIQWLGIRVVPVGTQESLNALLATFFQNGYQPYSDLFVTRMPLFVLMLDRVWTSDILGLRLVFVWFNILFGLVTALLGRYFWGEKVALLSLLLLAVSLPYVALSVAAVPDLLSISLSLWAIWLVIQYLRTARMVWLVLSGFLFAGSVLLNFLAIYSAAIMAILLLSPYVKALQWDAYPPLPKQFQSGSAIFRLGADAGRFLLGGMILPALLLVVFDSQAMYSMTLGFRLILREALIWDVSRNFQYILQFWADAWLIHGGILLGIYFAQSLRRHCFWLFFLWWFLSNVWLMLQVALRPENLALLWMPTILMSGWGFIRFGETLLKRSPQITLRFPQAALVLSLVLVLIGGGFSVIQAEDYRNRARQIEDIDDLERIRQLPAVARFLQNTLPSEACVVVDNPGLALQSQRYPPAILVDFSPERIASGYLEETGVQSHIETFQCQALVISDNQTRRLLPNLETWAKDFYANQQSFSDINVFYDNP